MKEENLPISADLEVIKWETIKKTGNWWYAVVVYRTHNRRAMAVYCWCKVAGRWTRKQKMSFLRPADWERTRGYLDKYVAELNPLDIYDDGSTSENTGG